jgi:iron(III) transport system permease protein
MRARLPSSTALFFLAVVAILIWLIAIPLGEMLLSSFRSGHPVAPGPFSFKNYRVAYGSPLTYRMILNTLVFAAGGTAVTAAIAISFAWLLERTDMPLRNLCWSLLLIPLAMPGLLFSMAYVFLLMPTSGLVNVWLRDLFSSFGVKPTRSDRSAGSESKAPRSSRHTSSTRTSVMGQSARSKTATGSS